MASVSASGEPGVNATKMPLGGRHDSDIGSPPIPLKFSMKGGPFQLAASVLSATVSLDSRCFTNRNKAEYSPSSAATFPASSARLDSTTIGTLSWQTRILPSKSSPATSGSTQIQDDQLWLLLRKVQRDLAIGRFQDVVALPRPIRRKLRIDCSSATIIILGETALIQGKPAFSRDRDRNRSFARRCLW
jgi:hypothetical protein